MFGITNDLASAGGIRLAREIENRLPNKRNGKKGLAANAIANSTAPSDSIPGDATLLIYESQKLKLIECPRDAWQGLPGLIPTELKVRYLRGAD